MAVLCASLGLASALLFDPLMFCLFALSLVLGYLYNCPPIQLKNHAWGGVIANALGHGMLTFLVGWHAVNIGQPFDKEFLRVGLISSLAPSFANGAVFLATTIPDALGDRLTEKKTFCVVYGEKATSIVASLFCSAALIFSFFIAHHAWVMIVPSAVSLVFFIILAATTKQDMAFKSFKWPVFLLSAFVALFVPYYGILILLTFYGSRLYYRSRFGIEYPSFKSE